MPHIQFTSNPKLPADMVHLGYKKGQQVDLSVDSCERWIRRGVAVYVPEVVAAAPVAEPAALPAESDAEKPDAPPIFDPTTAEIAEVRAFLIERGVSFGPRASEAKIREMALEILTR